MLIAEIEIRRTHRYVDTFAHLDCWVPVAEVRVTPARVAREPSDFDDGGTYVRWVRVPARAARTVKPKDIKRGLEDTFTSTGCHHEYDCCGCLSVRASARRVGRRDWVIRESHSFNY